MCSDCEGGKGPDARRIISIAQSRCSLSLATWEGIREKHRPRGENRCESSANRCILMWARSWVSLVCALRYYDGAIIKQPTQQDSHRRLVVLTCAYPRCNKLRPRNWLYNERLLNSCRLWKMQLFCISLAIIVCHFSWSMQNKYRPAVYCKWK